MTGKIDITSSSIEKGLDVAREFLDRLIMPATEELGLLVKDRVSFWRMKNQISVATKAKKYCEANGIEPAQVSPKLLLPLMEGAALEEDESMQEKWAVLMSKLVDSEQNIQNHVFPYILGQISVTEFSVLENVFKGWQKRTRQLNSELQRHQERMPRTEARLVGEIETLEEKTRGVKKSGKRLVSSEA